MHAGGIIGRAAHGATDSRVVVSHFEIVLVEAGSKVLLSGSNTHSVGNSLSEGTCTFQAFFTPRSHRSLNVKKWIIQQTLCSNIYS